MDDVNIIRGVEEAVAAAGEAAVARELGHALKNARRRRLVEEFAVDFNACAAARRVGYSNPGYTVSHMRKDPQFMADVRAKLDQLEADSALRAQYVREYIFGALELCPTDFFQLAPDGDWVIDLDEFNQLPTVIKRYVEGIEVKYVGGQKMFKVKFISKRAALAIAAQFTLTQKIEATVTAVPWDEIARRAIATTTEVDPVVAAIEAVGAPREAPH